MGVTDEFDKLQKKVHKLEEEQQQTELNKSDIEDARKEAHQKLASLKKQKADIIKEESDLNSSLQDQKRELEALEKTRRSQDNSYHALMKQLSESKVKRNNKLMQWWMDQYGNFDDMNLTQLKDWLTSAVLSQRKQAAIDADDDDNEDAMYKRHLAELRRRQSSADDDLEKSQAADEDDDSDDDSLSSSSDASQTLADKQRTYGNQIKNHPIQTQSEAEDAEEEESPFGDEDLNKELDEYENSVADSDTSKNLTRSQVAAEFHKEFEL